MNYQDELDRRQSAIVRRAKEARRAVRQTTIYGRLGEALGKPSARQASWNMPLDREEVHAGTPIGASHPGAAALIVVRGALSEYTLPEVKLRFQKISRRSGHGPYAMDEGEVWVEASFSSLSGARHTVDIPLVVHEGRLLHPSVMKHAGSLRVITQSAFDDIIGRGEFTQKLPDRPNMYSPPPDKRQQAASPPRQVPILRPGMFKVVPSRRMISGAVKGVRTADFEQEAGPKDWLAGGALALGMGMAGPGQAAPAQGGDYTPNQNVRETNKNVYPEKGPWQPSPSPNIKKEMSALMAKYAKDPRLQSFFGEGQQMSVDLKAALKRLGEIKKQQGPTSPAAQAFRDGVHHGELAKKLTDAHAKEGSGRLAVAPAVAAAVEWLIAHPKVVATIVGSLPALADLARTAASGKLTLEDAKRIVKAVGVAAVEAHMPKTAAMDPELDNRILELVEAVQHGQLTTEEATDVLLYETRGRGGNAQEALFALEDALAAEEAAARHDHADEERHDEHHMEGGAPPGREDQVKELKKDPNIDNPWAVAWSSYNKSQGKQGAGKKDRSPPASPAAVNRLRNLATELKRRDVAMYDNLAQMGVGSAPPRGGWTEQSIHAQIAYFERLIAETPDRETSSHLKMKPPPRKEESREAPHLLDWERMGRRGFYEADIDGLIQPGTGAEVPGAGRSHLDPAERPRGTLGPGDKVKMKAEGTTRDLGGGAYAIPKGTAGVVVRDWDGCDYAYIVQFPSLGFACKVPREKLAG